MKSKIFYKLFLFLVLASLNTIAQPGAIDLSFNSTDVGYGNGDGAGSSVYTSAIQIDGKVIIGGGFTTFNGTSRNCIARLNSDGSLDNSFDPGTGSLSDVYEIILQNDGKAIICGAFTTINGISRKGIARLNTDGSVDATFNSAVGVDGLIKSISLQTDGKVIIGGEFSNVGATPRNNIARLNANGSLDTGFNPGIGADNDVYETKLQNDGKLIICGAFSSFNGTTRKCIARLNSNGTLDASFNPGTGAIGGNVQTAVLQSDAKIVIGGSFTSYNGTSRNFIARVNIDGSLDAGFDPGTGPSGTVFTNVYQSDGKIIIGGGFSSYNGTARVKIARLNIDGSLDAGFNPGTGANNTVNSLTLQTDGMVIIGGGFTSYNLMTRNRIARLNVDGAVDASFISVTGTNGIVYTSLLQSNGKIIISGDFSSFNNTIRNKIARMNSDGSIDASFNPGFGPNNYIFTSALQNDGKVIIGGGFSNINLSNSRNRIARLNEDGTLDTGFNPGTGANGDIIYIFLQSDNKVIIGGNFTLYNGTTRNRIARLNANGSLDTGFNPGTGANNSINSIVVQSDGKVIIGGTFTSINGTTRNRIARLNSDGSLDVSFNPGAGFNFTVYALGLQSDGKIIIGGDFTSFNGTLINRIARLNSDGTIDTNFNPGAGANNHITTLVFQNDGKIIIGGSLNTFDGTTRNRIARLNSNGSLDITFNPGTGPSSTVLTLALQTDCKIVIGGNFTSYNGTGRNRIARIIGDNSIIISTIDPTGMFYSGSAINVSFVSTGVFNAGNTFTAQLSDASGSFTAPDSIGSSVGNTSGSINCTIPCNIPVGNGYRIRVISDQPAVTGIDNGVNIIINSSPVAIASNNGPLCEGSTLQLFSGGGTSYSWSGSNGFFSTLQSPVVTNVTPSNSGNYTVVVSNANGCTNSANTSVTINPSVTYYADADVDGFGNSSNTQQLCAPAGIFTSLVGGDCNDNLFSVHPGVTEVCGNSIDDDCNGSVDEGCTLTLNLKAIIQGMYTGGGLMDNFGAGGNLFFLGVPGANADDVDTVYISVMNASPPYDEIEMQKGILKTNGEVSVSFSNAIAGQSYYVRVRHRNSIEIWSKFPVLFSLLTNYDFTDASTKAYDDGFHIPMKLVDTFPNRWAIYTGDIDRQGGVDAGDMTMEENAANAGIFGYYPSDLNGDGSSDSIDMTIIENNGNAGVFETHP